MERKTVLRTCIWLLIIVFSMSFFSMNVNSAWFDSNWAYRQNINITANVNTPTNYQVLLVLDNSDLGSNFDWSNSCADLRFIGKTSGSVLDYWIEDCDTVSEEIYVWIKTDSAISSGNDYEIELYYNNPLASSLSSASDTFLQNQIHLVNGRCTSATYCNGMDSHGETDYIRSQIGTSPFTIDGQGYVTGVNDASNPWGSDDYYYSRYRFLFIPTSGGNYDFGTNSDDGSEITIFPYDGYGGGLATLHPYGAHDVTGFWYGLHGTGTCGSSGTRYTRSLTAGQGYWFDYIMNEWGGGQLAQMCVRNGGSYRIVNTANFPNQLFARTYVTSEPSFSSISSEETYTYLEVNVNEPNPLSVKYVLENKVFDFNVTVNCIGPAGENCGIVQSYARQNSSGSFVNIPTSSSSPMWTSSSQGQSCNLNSGDSCDLTFSINASGVVGNYYFINLLSSSSNPNIDSVISDNSRIRIIDTNIVSFNQTIYDFGNFTKNSGDESVTLKVESNIGNNNNIEVDCISGDCLFITDNWVDGINLVEGSSQDIEFVCNDDYSGFYDAVFRVTSDGNPYFSEIQVSCNVLPIYGPMLVSLNNPTPLGNISVRQNNTFVINASVDCIGTCGQISAYSIFSKPGWWDLDWNYKREISIFASVNTPINYQVLLALDDSDLGSNFDWSNSCADLRFIGKTSGSVLDYWIEDCDIVSEEIYVWVKIDSAISSGNNYDLDIYYGNTQALSLSNVSNTFRNDEIFQIYGRCPSSNANCNMENHGETNNIRAGIGTGVFTVDGQGYTNEINMANNPYGLNDNFYGRYRWLFIPQVNGVYRFGSFSDDSSEITIFPYDGYGGGIRTGTPYGAHDIITYLYNSWHNNLACGDTTRFTILPRTFEAGKGYWMDYTMQEGTGGEDAIACTSIDSTIVSDYNLFSTGNFPNQIFARNYVTPEPTVVSIGSEDSLIISTNGGDIPLYTFNSQPQICVPVEDGSCSFKWIVNATGLVGSEYDVSVLFISNISSILKNETLKSKVIITDFIVPTITLISPVDNVKKIVNGNVSFVWQVDDDSALLDCSLYLNDVFNQSNVCSNSGNNSLNLSLGRGYYNWSIEVDDGDGNIVRSSVWDFYLIKNDSREVSKSIKYENLNMYKISIKIKDLVGNNLFGSFIEWVVSSLNSGSQNPLEDLNENVFDGEYIIWNEKDSINYSIAGVGDDYKIGKSYVIGLD